MAKRQSKADRKLAKKPSSTRLQKKFGYDYDAALELGFGPDSTGHWPSRSPITGQILKGRKHPTIGLTKKTEKELGYKITKKKGVLYSQPKKKK